MFVGDVRFAAGSTVWCLVDMKTRPPMNVSRTLPGLPEDSRDAMVTDFPRRCLPENMGGHWTLLPRNSEIDMNGGVNNAVYVNWALETLPSSLQQRDRSVSELLAFFRNEAGIGQEILSQPVFHQREDFLKVSIV